MQSAAGRMQILINDLLMFSRVESKAQPFTKVDLDTVTREVLSDLEIQLERTGAVIEVEGLPVIEADPLQMRQLMQNLISNSLKYSQEGRPPVIKIRGHIVKDKCHATSACRDQGGELCQIQVEDNGIGFDEKYLDRIFTVFQRLHVRQEYEGTGIGLAVCRKIVERHWGSITARSKPGQGATFIATLPVSQPSGGIE
jgi:signal transduction histidine kinase